MSMSRGRGRVGLLVPFTNSNFEPDMAMMMPDGFSLHVARMGGYDAQEIPDAGQMQSLGDTDLEGPLRLLAGVKPDVVIYGCTSATLTHGTVFDRELAARIAAETGAPTVTAAGAIVDALHCLKVSRIGFASPYVPEINDMAIRFLQASGVETVSRADFPELLDNDGQGALSPGEVYALGLAADSKDAQAIVLSCTDMRSAETVQKLEGAVGKPVICSNQAIVFASLRALGVKDKISGFGQLLADPQAALGRAR